MELFDLSADQLNAISLIISKDFSIKYNTIQLTILSVFFTNLGSNIAVYSVKNANVESTSTNT
ncbi:hypothetical protein [Clostridium sp.]|uniref:hypothetical protein n=1 Tax=Clostridium sp. TaxID=1506 RepID=UPI002630F221